MRHTYECPIRWADMDMLGHVNNVTYVDFLQEARIDMFAEHASFRGGEELAEGVVVVRHEVEFVAPLTFRREPVLVDSWITEVRAASFSMAYEVYDEGAEGSRTVYLRATSVLAPFVFETERPRRIRPEERAVLEQYLEPQDPRTPLASTGSPRHTFPLRVRWSDVDAYRHVNNVAYLEFLQEARVRYLMDLHHRGEQWNAHVLARTDVDYRRPILFRREPYEVRSWVSHVGERSFTIAAEICDDEEVLARAQVVMVTFDMESQRSAAMPADQRVALLAELTGSPGGG